MSAHVTFVPAEDIARARAARGDDFDKLSLVADMCRANTLSAVKRAGSGHLGSSLSAMDIVVWLYEKEMNTVAVGPDSPDRDVYFSSKGHDVPGLYAVLHGLGIVPFEKLLRLRRYGGLDGHPDVGVRGVEANSGSLGMGISKGRGIAWAKRKAGRGGRVFVMLGDGELQEGQNYEALQAAVQQRIENLICIVDHNKVQSDRLVSDIVDLGDLPRKLGAFGWHVARCDGHDFRALARVLEEFRGVRAPKILIADTIKGKGVSFMEHPRALAEGGGYYRFHAGAPGDPQYAAAHAEVMERVRARAAALDLPPPALVEPGPEPRLPASLAGAERLDGEPASRGAGEVLLGEPVSAGAARAPVAASVSDEFVAQAYGRALVDVAPRCPELVVLDGDLAADCRVREFELAFPDRFIENGIAEQDMASMAAGLARHGFLPVVNSFANFLAARANEQIYNAASERTKIIWALHYAGLIPAGPGKSHQSIRDISLLAALPNVVILQPACAEEARLAVEWAVFEARDSVALRFNIGPSPRRIELPSGHRLVEGRGAVLREGGEAVLFSYGPVMLHEALLAAEALAGHLAVRVVDMPWLNRCDPAWLAEVTAGARLVAVLEDHAPVGGLGDRLLPHLARQVGHLAAHTHVFGVEGFPACGSPAEALRHHGLDGASVARRLAALAGD